MKRILMWFGICAGFIAVTAGTVAVCIYQYRWDQYQLYLKQGPPLQKEVRSLTDQVYRVVRVYEPTGSFLRVLVEPTRKTKANILDNRILWEIPYNHQGWQDFYRLAESDEVVLGVIGHLDELYKGKAFDHVKPMWVARLSQTPAHNVAFLRQ